jgi:hypothetical protein
MWSVAFRGAAAFLRGAPRAQRTLAKYQTGVPPGYTGHAFESPVDSPPDAARHNASSSRSARSQSSTADPSMRPRASQKE